VDHAQAGEPLRGLLVFVHAQLRILVVLPGHRDRGVAGAVRELLACLDERVAAVRGRHGQVRGAGRHLKRRSGLAEGHRSAGDALAADGDVQRYRIGSGYGMDEADRRGRERGTGRYEK
jgi:hypothetical protein